LQSDAQDHKTQQCHHGKKSRKIPRECSFMGLVMDEGQVNEGA